MSLDDDQQFLVSYPLDLLCDHAPCMVYTSVNNPLVSTSIESFVVEPVDINTLVDAPVLPGTDTSQIEIHEEQVFAPTSTMLHLFHQLQLEDQTNLPRHHFGTLILSYPGRGQYLEKFYTLMQRC